MNKISIDFGTSKCCISYQKNNKLFIIKDNNKYFINSIIGIYNDNILIGNQINNYINYNITIINNLKRLIGVDIKTNLVIKLIKYHKWDLKYDDLRKDIIINGYLLSELIINIMIYLRNLIILNIGDDFYSVITIPNNFNNYQRNYILKCAEISKLNCNELLHEPISASLSYLYNFYNYKELDFIVFDFGAGTLDLSLINSSYENDEWLVEIIDTNGDNSLGGIDINILLSEWLKNNYINIYNKLLEDDNLNKHIEKIKIMISLSNEDINYNIDGYIINLKINEYYKLLDDNFKDKIIKLLNDLIKDRVIKGILLIGGSSKNKWLYNLLLNNNYKIINNNEKLLLDNDNLDFMDIAVSLGGIDLKNYNNKQLYLLNIISYSIGIEQMDGKMSKIINKNSIIPININKNYTIIGENNIDIKIYQGENDLCKDNHFIGSVNMDINNINSIINIDISIDKNNIIIIKCKEFGFDNEVLLNIDYNNSYLEYNENKLNYDIKQSNIMTSYYTLITNYNKILNNLFNDKNKKLSQEIINNYINKLIKNINTFYHHINNLNYINIQPLNNILSKINISINDDFIEINIDELQKILDDNIDTLNDDFNIIIL